MAAGLYKSRGLVCFSWLFLGKGRVVGVLVGGRIALDNLNLPLDIVPYSDVLYWVAAYVEDSLLGSGQFALQLPFSTPRASAGSKPKAAFSLGQPRPASASLGQSADMFWLAGLYTIYRVTGLVSHIGRGPRGGVRRSNGPVRRCRSDVRLRDLHRGGGGR